MKKILVAGIGNMFLGDDGFGCEVVSRLKPAQLPEEVAAIDFGIRSYDLAFALASDYDTVILVDATSRGEPAGTVYLIELDAKRLGKFEEKALDAHSMNPVSVIQMAQTFGAVNGKLYLVACEPEVLESNDGAMGLSEKVQAGISLALEMIETLLGELLDRKIKLKGIPVAA